MTARDVTTPELRRATEGRDVVRDFRVAPFCSLVALQAGLGNRFASDVVDRILRRATDDEIRELHRPHGGRR